MTREDEERLRRVDAILRRLGIPVTPLKRHGAPVTEGDGRTITRVSGQVLQVR